MKNFCREFGTPGVRSRRRPVRFVARHFYPNPFASVAAFVVVVTVASDVVVAAAYSKCCC